LVCNLPGNHLIINPTDKILAELLSFLDSDEGLRIESKSTCKKIFVNKNLLGNYVLFFNFNSKKNIYTFLNSRRNHALDRDCKSDEIVYLNTLSEVLEVIHREFEDIKVNEY
jgi:hypothetical protein